MGGATRELVGRYLDGIAGRWGDLEELVHPDAVFAGAVKEASGREAYIQGFRNLSPILLRVDVRQVVIEGDSAVVLYDFVTDTEVGAVLTTEWLKFEGDRIRQSVLLYDMRRWPVVLEELARRAAPAAPAHA